MKGEWEKYLNSLWGATGLLIEIFLFLSGFRCCCKGMEAGECDTSSALKTKSTRLLYVQYSSVSQIMADLIVKQQL